ncbi:heterokaryon incompatibility protein-domain-containing protein [Xylariaceae sp. FL0016]|nr:heterokaryon incompatibility protein-domain-containing protein [Xylariaceae sp. FL0016]
MSYEYRPLQGQDIRLITIEPPETGTDYSSPIRCTVEHVDLSSAAVPPDKPYKGQGHHWPEAYFPRNLSAIFKDPADAPQPEKVQYFKDADSQSVGESLPWRHEWGDFVALSYSWGPPTPVHRITLDDCSFFVGANLFQALLHIRLHERIREGFRLWIDAICINQNDVAERSAQVGRMKDIYTAAWHVVIWLGPEADNSGLAVSALSWIAERNRTQSPYEGFYRENTKIDARPLFIVWGTFKSPLKSSVYRALFFFLSRPYWQRMWILQEVIMARQDGLVVICGKSCLAWRDVYDAATFISNDETRFGRELVASARPRILNSWSFEFARDRVVSERDWSSDRMWNLLVEMASIQSYQHLQPQVGQDPRHPFELLRPLILARDAKVTEERDRVYGILGIRAVADHVHVIPDYTLSLSTIYRDFSAQHILQGNLDILRFVSRGGGQIKAKTNTIETPSVLGHRKVASVVGPMLSSLPNSSKEETIGLTCTHEVPTWTVCWTCKTIPTAQLRGLYRAGGSKLPIVPVISPEDGTLAVDSIVFDRIESLGTFHPAEVGDSYPQNALEPAVSAYGDLEATRTAFWRTILGNTTAHGGVQASKTGSWLLEPKIWDGGVAGVYTNGFGLHELMARNKKLVLGGYTLEHLIFGPDRSRWRQKIGASERIYNPSEEQREVLSWAMNATAWRRLIGTSDGRVGLTPAAAREGDVLAILRGCSTPMVLRKLGKRWQLVGESYIYGAMDEEILKGDLESSAIVIC